MKRRHRGQLRPLTHADRDRKVRRNVRRERIPVAPAREVVALRSGARIARLEVQLAAAVTHRDKRPRMWDHAIWVARAAMLERAVRRQRERDAA